MIEFIDTSFKSLLITINYNAIANLPTTQITKTCTILTLVLFCTLLCSYRQLTTPSRSHIATDGQSVCLSVLVSSPGWGSWPDVSSSLELTVLSMWGALYDERSGLSFVIVGSISPLSFVQLFTILLLKPNRMYNIHKASVSPGSVQQAMPYF
jgi:hypothetical protein